MKKSILAKLLAKENITVQHGNYQTAWFDIKDRVLGLPLWKDVSNDVYDLLIGHEVGHALETPYEGWHDSPEQLEGCPRSYINVIEDARIERKIKDRYAGLVGPMARGYKNLFDDGFFGQTADIDWNKTKLIDKINLHAKVGMHLNVPFTSEEKVFMDRAMTTTTFDEVVDLVRDIYDWTKENQEDLLTKPNTETNFNEEPNEDFGGHDDGIPNEDQNAEDSLESDGNTNVTEKQSDVYEADQDTIETVTKAGGSDEIEEQSETDQVFREREREFVATEADGSQPLVCNQINNDIINKIVIPYKDLAKDRAKVRELYNDASIEQKERDTYEVLSRKSYKDFEDDYRKYIKEVKRSVTFAVKEFEMKKAAYRYTRAQTSRTGSVDVNKLWSYKTNDDIFSRVTQLADSKNHGLMMLIDYSGSMNSVLRNVIDQTIHLVLFCKAVNIPFEVYAFTSGCNPNFSGDSRYFDEHSSSIQKDGEVYHGRAGMPQLISSSLSKKDFEEALYALYIRNKYTDLQYEGGWGWNINDYVTGSCERLGSTPLNVALMVSHKLIKNFIRKNNVEKMNFVVISDGETDTTNVVKRSNVNHVDYSWNKAVYVIDGKKIHGNTRAGGTKALLENIQSQFNATTLGFFISNSQRDYRHILSEATWEKRKNTVDHMDYFTQAQKEFKIHRCVTINDVYGYNQFYILKKNLMDTEADEFDVEDDATNRQIMQSFKKHSKSKKTNKTLLTNFGRAVAL